MTTSTTTANSIGKSSHKLIHSWQVSNKLMMSRTWCSITRLKLMVINPKNQLGLILWKLWTREGLNWDLSITRKRLSSKNSSKVSRIKKEAMLTQSMPTLCKMADTRKCRKMVRWSGSDERSRRSMKKRGLRWIEKMLWPLKNSKDLDGKSNLWLRIELPSSR